MTLVHARLPALARLVVHDLTLLDVWNVGLVDSLEMLELQRNTLRTLRVAAPLCVVVPGPVEEGRGCGCGRGRR